MIQNKKKKTLMKILVTWGEKKRKKNMNILIDSRFRIEKLRN